MIHHVNPYHKIPNTTYTNCNNNNCMTNLSNNISHNYSYNSNYNYNNFNPNQPSKKYILLMHIYKICIKASKTSHHLTLSQSNNINDNQKTNITYNIKIVHTIDSTKQIPTQIIFSACLCCEWQPILFCCKKMNSLIPQP